MPKTEKLIDGLIGNRPCRFKISEGNPVNIVSSDEYMKLLALKLNFRTNELVQLQLQTTDSNTEFKFKGILATHLRLMNGKPQYANFYIREGNEDFVTITKELAEKLKVQKINPSVNAAPKLSSQSQ